MIVTKIRYSLIVVFSILLIQSIVYAQSTSVIPDELAFGEVLVGSSKQKTFSLINQGSNNEVIRSVSVGDPFSVLNTFPDTLSPGSIKTLTVLFNPSSTNSNQSFTSTVLVDLVTGNDINVNLNGKGVTRPEISVTASKIDFDTTKVNFPNPPRRTLLIRNTGTQTTENLEIIITKVGADAFAVLYPTNFYLQLSIPAGGSEIVELEFAPTSAGRQEALLRIDHNDLSKGVIEIPLLGYAEPIPLEARFGEVPESLPLLRAPIGNADSSEVFAITSASDSLKILSLTTSNEDFSVSIEPGYSVGDQIPDGNSLNARVVFNPTRSDTQQAVLYVLSNDPDESVKEISLVGYGSVAELEIDGNITDIDLGSALLGSSMDNEVFIIRNKSDIADLSIKLNLSSPNFSLISEAEFTLAPGQEKPISIRFAPTIRDSQQAVLYVLSNDPDESVNEIWVMGYGYAAELRILPEENRIDFGSTSVGSTNNRQELTLQNISLVETLNLSIEITSPEFTLRTATNLSIPPGEEEVVSVDFQPSSIGQHQASLFINPVNVPDANRISYQLIGIGTGASIKVNNSNIEFGSVDIGVGKYSNIVIENTGTTVLRANLSTDSPFYVVPSFVQLNPENSQEIDVFFNPENSGFFDGTIRIENNDWNANQREITVSLSGEARRGIRIKNQNLDYGNVAIGQIALLPLLIENTSSQDLTGSLQISNDVFFVSETAVKLAANESVIIDVGFNPSSIESYNGVITFTSDTRDEDLREIVINLSGTGQRGQLSLNATVLDFGTLRNQVDSKTDQLLLTNVGNKTVIIEELLIGDSQFKVETPLPISLNPDESANISITYSPTSIGDREITVSLISDDPVQPLYKLRLKGNSVISTIGVFPEVVDFGDVSIPNSEIREITILNTGMDILKVFSVTSTESAVEILESSFPLSIDPSGRVTFRIRFTPHIAGSFSSDINLQSDDPEMPIATVVTLGNGVNTKLSFDSLNFGEVRIGGEPAELLLNVTNEENTQAEITVIPISVPQFENTPASYIISPQQTIQIPVKFTPKDVENVIGIMTIVDLNGTKFQVELSGSGTKPNLDLRPPEIDFGPNRIGDRDTTLVNIENVGNAPLRVEKVSIQQNDDQVFSLLTQPPFTINPGQLQPLEFVFAPIDSIFYAGEAIVFSDDLDESEQKIQISGSGIGPLLAVTSADSFSFGAVLRNGSNSNSVSERSIEVKIDNIGSDTLFVISTGIEDVTEQFDITSGLYNVLIPPGKGEIVVVTFRPNIDGEKLAVFSVTTGSSIREIERFTLSGIGVSPRIDTNVNELVFEKTKINLPLALTNADTVSFTVANRGSAELEILQMYTDDELQFQVVSPTFPISIAPDGRVNVQVRFVPIVPNIKDLVETTVDITSNLFIETNEVDSRDIVLSLVGQGTASNIEVPSELRFGSIRVGDSGEQILEIKNTGETATLIAAVSDRQFEILGDQLFNVESGTRNIRIRFTPTSRNDNQPIQASMTLQDTTTKRTREILLNGEGLQSKLIVVSEDERIVDLIDFGNFRVRKGTGTRKTVIVRNLGNAVLEANVSVSSEQFSLLNSSENNFSIDPGSERDVSIVFRPQLPGDSETNLFISSTDNSSDNREITLQGKGIIPSILIPEQFNWNNVEFNSSNYNEIKITNTGEDSLEVYEVKLTGYIESFSVNDVNFNVPPQSSYTLGCSLHAANPDLLDNPSINLSIVYENSSTPNPDSSQIALIPIEYKIVDSSPPKVSLLSPSLFPDLEIESTSLSFEIQENTGRLKTAETALWWRLGGQSNSDYRSDLLDIEETEKFNIKKGNVTISKPLGEGASRGIEYYVRVVDEAGNETIIDKNPSDNRIDPYSLRYRVESLSGVVFDGEDEVKNSHRIISVPMELDDESIGNTLSLILGKDVEKPEKTQWRLFDWDNTTQSLEEFFPGKSTMGGFSVGKAFWLVVRSAKVSLEIGNSTTIPTDQPFEDILLKRGWNLVGTPFNFTIPWENIKVGTSSARIAGLEFYDFNSDYDSGVNEQKRGAWSNKFPSIGMKPWHGYAVWSPNDNTRLSILPSEERNSSGKIVDSPYEWSMEIAVDAYHSFDGNNRLGVHADAREQKDVFDEFEPPAIGEYVAGYFVSVDQENPDTKYTSDIRGNIDNGSVWHFNVENSLKNSRIKLRFEKIESVPSAYSLMLIDLDNYEFSDLRKSQEYEFVGSQMNRFKIVIGPDDFVDSEKSEVLPISSTITRNYPNPFNATTSIFFQIARAEYVRMNIYDVTGQRVKTLINDRINPGRHSIVWNGTNDNGNEVGSGVYFCFMKTPDSQKTQKLMLIK